MKLLFALIFAYAFAVHIEILDEIAHDAVQEGIKKIPSQTSILPANLPKHLVPGEIEVVASGMSKLGISKSPRPRVVHGDKKTTSKAYAAAKAKRVQKKKLEFEKFHFKILDEEFKMLEEYLYSWKNIFVRRYKIVLDASEDSRFYASSVKELFLHDIKEVGAMNAYRNAQKRGKRLEAIFSARIQQKGRDNADIVGYRHIDFFGRVQYFTNEDLQVYLAPFKLFREQRKVVFDKINEILKEHDKFTPKLNNYVTRIIKMEAADPVVAVRKLEHMKNLLDRYNPNIS